MQRKLDGLERLRGDVERLVKRNSLDEDVRYELNERLREADRLAEVVLVRDGFLDFLSRHISHDHTRYTQPERLGNDGTERQEPLCLCNDRYCPLKKGELPRQIRVADDPREAMRTYADSHAGEPVVIHDARDEFRERVVDCWYQHRRILNCAQNNTLPDDLKPSGQPHQEPADD